MMGIFTTGTLLTILTLLTYQKCSATETRKFMKYCSSANPPLGVLLGAHVTRRRSECALTCLNTLHCHYVSVKPAPDGNTYCRMYRPYVHCPDFSTNTDDWTTYGMLGTCVCEDGWSLYQRKCYKYFHSFMTWEAGRDLCVTLNSSLPSVSFVGVNNFLANLPSISGYGDRVFWLGGTDNATEGTWKWITGEPYVESYFGADEPDGGVNENALGMWIGGYWFDDSFYYMTTWRVVCERVCQIF